MIFAANFKTHHTRAATTAYIEALAPLAASIAPAHRVIVFPPATALQERIGDVALGAQNAYPVDTGAVTGEIGLAQLREFDIATVLVGHSERRHLLYESDEMIADKCHFYLQAGLEVMVCIGEPMTIRHKGEQAVADYLDRQLDRIDVTHPRLLVAYEPIWAIGTGESATAETIAATHAHIRSRTDAPILYGGSVKADNSAAIAAIDHVDGVLVGSASLDAQGFSQLIRHALNGN